MHNTQYYVNILVAVLYILIFKFLKRERKEDKIVNSMVAHNTA
jgi:hypothetical protein